MKNASVRGEAGDGEKVCTAAGRAIWSVTGSGRRRALPAAARGDACDDCCREDAREREWLSAATAACEAFGRLTLAGVNGGLPWTLALWCECAERCDMDRVREECANMAAAAFSASMPTPAFCCCCCSEDIVRT